MSAPADRRAALDAALRQAADLLRAHGVPFWPERLESHAENVRSANSSAIADLLGDFGGMGSFNDVWIDPRNGHRVSPHQIQPVNQRFDQLRSKIYQLSQAL